jgi:hypothetical protein
MLRRTSKRVKGVVDKMRLPAVVRLSRSFWDDTRNGTAAEKLRIVMRQLAVATARCRISTLELPRCEMNGQDAESLAEVLGQCRELVHLDLSGNQIGDAGTERLAGVGQCAALTHLDLYDNFIGAVGAERLAGVLGQCTALAHLDLSRLICQSTVTFLSLSLSRSLAFSLCLSISLAPTHTRFLALALSLSRVRQRSDNNARFARVFL